MKFSRPRITTGILSLAAFVVLSSCNRGYGCPTNFNMNDCLVDAVQTVVNFIF
jgi:hypothetical protein